eukprot:1970494-Prorocentrum_lima.AAC.1
MLLKNNITAHFRMKKKWPSKVSTACMDITGVPGMSYTENRPMLQSLVQTWPHGRTMASTQ